MHAYTPASNRLDYLDAVRAFALILGIIFHASLSFMPIFIGWAVMDISTSDLVPVFVLLSHSFRLALFFLIAGFFSHMAFHQKGAQAFLKSRFVRIAAPFVIGWFLLRPMLEFGWVMGAESMRGDVNMSNALLAGLHTLAELPNSFLLGTHLWFLYYLLLMSISVIGLRYLINLHTPTKERVVKTCDRATSWISKSPFGILVIAFPTAACLWFMAHWGIDTPDKSLSPVSSVSILYGGFFVFGWLLHRQPTLVDAFAKVSVGKVILCTVSIIIALSLSGFEAQLAHQHYNLLKVSYMLSYAVMMWSLISLVIGLGQRLFSRPNKIVRYVADASYWLYLIHLPIVIGLQIAFAELSLHWALKLTFICVITLSISILLYDLCVRSSWLGVILNGKRKPRLLFNYSKQQALTE